MLPIKWLPPDKKNGRQFEFVLLKMEDGEITFLKVHDVKDQTLLRDIKVRYDKQDYFFKHMAIDGESSYEDYFTDIEIVRLDYEHICDDVPSGFEISQETINLIIDFFTASSPRLLPPSG